MKMATSFVLVPPFIKYSSGPLLGPALLKSAAHLKGHQCRVIDFNAILIKERLVSPRVLHGVFLGDHDKPMNGEDSLLAQIETDFLDSYLRPCFSWGMNPEAARRIHYGFYTHQEANEAAILLSDSLYFPFENSPMKHGFSSWVQSILKRNSYSEPPSVVGVSLLHAGQVIPAAAMSLIIRKMWPETLICWGGPHVSGLGASLEKEMGERVFADIYVTGHAEETFTGILDMFCIRKRIVAPGIVLQGKRGTRAVAPLFDNLGVYDLPLTLPAQSSLGCAYGRCTFCTYPSIEPVPTRLPLLESVDSVAELASSMDATIAIKDSLATPLRLNEISECINGRVRWSACTKLSSKLDKVTLKALQANGLGTLEVGIETLLRSSQNQIKKVQSQEVFQKFLFDVASVSGDFSLVVNYMTDFPWENSVESLAKLDEVKSLVSKVLGERGCVEHNSFELERLAPIARTPALFGIRSVTAWPWASVLEYEKTIEK